MMTLARADPALTKGGRGTVIFISVIIVREAARVGLGACPPPEKFRISGLLRSFLVQFWGEIV